MISNTWRTPRSRLRCRSGQFDWGQIARVGKSVGVPLAIRVIDQTACTLRTEHGVIEERFLHSFIYLFHFISFHFM